MPSDSFFTCGSLMAACLLVSIADEWCGIIASIYSLSDIKVWLRRKLSASINTSTLPPAINPFVFLLGYIPPINSSMSKAMGETMSSDIYIRVRLRYTWLMSSTFRNITVYIIRKDTNSIRKNLGYGLAFIAK